MPDLSPIGVATERQEFIPGRSLTVPCLVLDADGTPLNLTNATVEVAIERPGNAPDVATGTFATAADPTTGRGDATFDVAATDLAGDAFERYGAVNLVVLVDSGAGIVVGARAPLAVAMGVPDDAQSGAFVGRQLTLTVGTEGQSAAAEWATVTDISGSVSTEVASQFGALAYTSEGDAGDRLTVRGKDGNVLYQSPPLTGPAGEYVGLSLAERGDSAGAVTWSTADGTWQTATLTSAATVTLASPADDIDEVFLDITTPGGFAFAVVGAIYPGGDEPTWTEAGTYTVYYVTTDGGATWRGYPEGSAPAPVAAGGSVAPVVTSGTRHLTAPGWAVTAAGTVSLNVGSTFYYPITFDRDVTVDRLAIEVTGGADAGGTVRLGLYRAGDDWQPGDLVVDAGTVDTTTLGVKTAAVAETLTAGRYLLALHVGTAVPTLRTYKGGSPAQTIAATMGATATLTNWRRASATTPHPDPGGPWSISTNVVPPFIAALVRISG